MCWPRRAGLRPGPARRSAPASAPGAPEHESRPAPRPQPLVHHICRSVHAGTLSRGPPATTPALSAASTTPIRSPADRPTPPLKIRRQKTPPPAQPPTAHGHHIIGPQSSRRRSPPSARSSPCPTGRPIRLSATYPARQPHLALRVSARRPSFPCAYSGLAARRQ